MSMSTCKTIFTTTLLNIMKAAVNLTDLIACISIETNKSLM